MVRDQAACAAGVSIKHIPSRFDVLSCNPPIQIYRFLCRMDPVLVRFFVAFLNPPFVYAFALHHTMVLCGDCGELYRRVHWNNHGCKSIVWRCISRLEPISAEKSCTNRTVNELLLQEITVKAINQILTERDLFLKTLQQNIAKAVVGADTLSPDGIQARLEELQKELIKKANNKQDYDAIADEIFRLRDQKEKSELDSHHREEAMKRIKELQNFIARQETDITEFDETLVKKLIEKITVFADHFTVEFKSGITIDIEA